MKIIFSHSSQLQIPTLNVREETVNLSGLQVKLSALPQNGKESIF